MPKKFYKEMPDNYPVCMHRDCHRAGTCLHQIAYNALLEKCNCLYLINPLHCTQDEQCKHYRDNTPVTYARGFTKFQQQMFPGQYQKFMHMLIGRFGRNPYFERRKGLTALSPREQQIVQKALQLVGVNEVLKFDQYEEGFNWYD